MPTAAFTADEHVDVTNSSRITPVVSMDAHRAMGMSSQGLIQETQSLSTSGIDPTMSSPPKLVVIGDKNAGKSSVIEALYDVPLPRGEDTCTRCPFQITTTAQQDPAISWRCTISILRKYAYSSDSIAVDATAGADFAEWRALEQVESLHFAVVSETAQLELVLRRAQEAVLNQDTVGFSPNVISLKIEAPGLPELSLVDLPGAICATAQEPEEFQVAFIEALLKVYVRDEKALILLVCAGDRNVSTVFSFRILNSCKVRHRAIGVLTKADLIELPSPERPGFEGILQNDDFALSKGWFITRQLSQRELGLPCRMTHEQARRQEAEFFAAEPWGTALPQFTDRFGTANLRKAISDALAQHTLDGLPSIQAHIEDQKNQGPNEDTNLPMFKKS